MCAMDVPQCVLWMCPSVCYGCTPVCAMDVPQCVLWMCVYGCMDVPTACVHVPTVYIYTTSLAVKDTSPLLSSVIGSKRFKIA